FFVIGFSAFLYKIVGSVYQYDRQKTRFNKWDIQNEKEKFTKGD
ncbi:hypothetical protein OM7_06022, partial [Enterococcus faecium EnGen0046]